MAAPMMAYQKGTSIHNDTSPHDPGDKNQTKIPNTPPLQQRSRELPRYDSNHFLRINRRPSHSSTRRIKSLRNRASPHGNRRPDPGFRANEHLIRNGPPIAPYQRSIGREPDQEQQNQGRIDGPYLAGGSIRAAPEPACKSAAESPGAGGAPSGGRG